jgi:hypothetical protein
MLMMLEPGCGRRLRRAKPVCTQADCRFRAKRASYLNRGNIRAVAAFTMPKRALIAAAFALLTGSAAPPNTGGPTVETTASDLDPSAIAAAVAFPRVRTVSLSGRRHIIRRHRLVLRLCNWLGVTLIACLSATMFAVTLFSLIGR